VYIKSGPQAVLKIARTSVRLYNYYYLSHTRTHVGTHTHTHTRHTLHGYSNVSRHTLHLTIYIDVWLDIDVDREREGNTRPQQTINFQSDGSLTLTHVYNMYVIF